MYDTIEVCLCCVQQIYFDISGSHGESITTQCLSLSLSRPLSLSLSFLQETEP